MRIKTATRHHEISDGGLFTTDEDIFLPTVTLVRGQTICLRGASPRAVRVYAQEGEVIDGRPDLVLMHNGTVTLVACERGWHQL